MNKHKNKKKLKVVASIFSVLTVLFGVASFVFDNYGDKVNAALISSDPALRYRNRVANWTGRRTLNCRDDQTVLLQDRTVNTKRRVLINARGRCTLRIVRCKLHGNLVITAGGNAKVIIENSTLTGERTISANGSTRIEIYDSVIKGKRYAFFTGRVARVAYDAKTVIVGRKRGPKKTFERLPDGAKPAAELLRSRR